MDWEAKMPSWDLGTVVGPSGGAGGGLDLKLGGPTSWRPVPAAAAAAAVAPAPSSSPAAAKRARAGQAAAACSVEGCAADLSRCREYHRRHKVCEAHSKTPVVSVAGQQQRFCQQCSRFHLLVEFDEVKRSCRKRLDGHNRRRRKQQPDPLGPAGIFANHHGGTRFASYPQIFSTVTSMAPEHKWPGSIAVKTEADAFHVEQYYSSLQLNGAANAAASLFGSKERSKRFPFLSDHHGEGAFSCQQPFTITPSSESSSNSSSRHSNGNKMFAANDGGPDHNCALSLLSDSPTTQAAHIMIPAAVQAPLGGARIHYGGGGDGGGGVSLTGLSYASGIMGDNKSSAHAAMASSTRHAGAVTTASSVAAQLQQYHGYYQQQVNGDQVNSADAGASMQALPFSSW